MHSDSTWNDGGSIAEGLFTALSMLVCLAYGLKYIHGEGTKAWRDSFITVIFYALVAIQYYHILFAAVMTPSNYKSSRGYVAYRHDCMRSTKGGKQSSLQQDVNPCWCKPSRAVCTRIADNVVLDKSTCPTDGTAQCDLYDAAGNHIQSIPSFLDSRRDCKYGRGTSCTRNEPCTPCSIDTLEAFGSSRCQTCSDGAHSSCNFVEGVGPYCYEAPGSRRVVPCKTCCTVKYVNGSLPYTSSGLCIS